MVEVREPNRSLLRSIAELPGPRGLPLLGNVLELQPKRLHLILERWAQRYGAAYRFRLLNRPVVVLTGQAAIRTAMRDRPATFRRTANIEAVLHDMQVDGVFSAEGETWRAQRRYVAEALGSTHVRTFYPTLRAVTERLKRRWDAAAASCSAIDALSDLSLYTVDVTTNFAFGYDMNTLEHEGDVIQDHLARIFPMLNRRLNFPLPYWRFFRLPVDRKFDRSVAYIRTRVGEMIEAARERLQQASASEAGRPETFIEAMLAGEVEGKPKLSPAELYSNAMTILVAGEDTTASALAWALQLVVQDPAVQARLHAEADAVLGTHDVVADIGDAARLVYHQAVIFETLRLKSIAPLIFLEANVDTELDGIAIPAGTIVFLATRPHAVAERNGAPGSAFAPERWLEAGDSGRRSRDFAFGAGPRLCPGRNLAVLEMKVALSMIAKKFSFGSAPRRAAVYEEFSFAMVPRNVRLTLTKRNRTTR